MKHRLYFLSLIVGILILSLYSCFAPEVLKTLDADEIKTLGKKCESLYKSHIDAWNSRDADNLRLIYTDDIVHFDGRPLFEGIDSVIGMANFMFDQFPDWQMEAGETYISKDICVGTWINWGVFGFTKDDPGFEFDTLETRDDMISFWRTYYSQNFHQAIDDKDIVDDDFLLAFAASWSSGSASEVVKIVAKDAELEDSLYDISVVGSQKIGDYAKEFFLRSPTKKWELVYPFAESEVETYFKAQYPFADQGGVFSITIKDIENKPCELRVVVILTPNDEGTIQTQKIFYDADTLIACGWAN